MSTTIVIQIGNSDNKLTQCMWSHYVEYMRAAIANIVYRMHFQGGSCFDAPWQNACWVCEVSDEKIYDLKEAVRECRMRFEQESVAVTVGETEFC